jgi:hypothetical protein
LKGFLEIFTLTCQRIDVVYPQKYSFYIDFFRGAVIGVVFLVVGGLFGSVEKVSGQAPDQEPARKEIEMVPRGEEKRFAIGIPAHLPLKVTVKNVNSKRWAHDFEVEVTNTGAKPIYFLSLYLILPEINGLMGNRVGFWLKYGRAELLDFSAPLESDDVPLFSGEKYTLRIPEGSANGWDYLREKEGRPEPKAMKLTFQELNFGDGTGYSATSGEPVNIHRKMSLFKPTRKLLFPVAQSIQNLLSGSLGCAALT